MRSSPWRCISPEGESLRPEADSETLRRTVLASAISLYTRTRIGSSYIREQTYSIQTINGVEGVQDNDMVDKMVVRQ